MPYVDSITVTRHGDMWPTVEAYIKPTKKFKKMENVGGSCDPNNGVVEHTFSMEGLVQL